MVIPTLRTSALFSLLLATACAGGAAPPPSTTPSPPDAAEDAEGMEPVEDVVDADDVGTVEAYPDTVRAGRFDQGKMWTFELPPVEYLSERYGLEPDSAWFARARLGALRIPNCSASLVSPHGLVLTNHHCARTFITQVSREGEELLDRGFVARDVDDERAVDDFEADRLIRIVDVSDEVDAEVDTLPPEERPEAREAVVEAIRERILTEHGGEESGHVVEMISLYAGARTSAYVFRRFTDARLVMAPELEIGFFGGEPDNFTYPRYNLDFAFFRLYDGEGRPLVADPYFPVDDDGLEEGDPIFIVGNPGSTRRLQTVAQLEFRRDVGDPAIVDLLRSRAAVLDTFVEESPTEAEARDLRNTVFSLSNSLKAYRGQLRGLRDPVIVARRLDSERAFLDSLAADPTLQDRFGHLVGEMAALQERKRQVAPGFAAFLAMTSPDLASATLHRALLAFQILSARQSGGGGDRVDALVERLGSVPDQPEALDRALMAARFRDLVGAYGPDSDLVEAVLRSQDPEARAREIVRTSELHDSATAVTAAREGSLDFGDPAVEVVRAYLPAFIEFQQVVGEVVPEENRLAAELGRARWEVYGSTQPPDATFSLRLADGVVRGYPYNGTQAPPFTTLYGLYDRHFGHGGAEAWALPDRWLDARDRLDLSTPTNFVSTADIIGGNSGSPVLDEELELVGVVFDGNIESLPGDYIYLPELNRSVTVDIRAILEALDVVYDSDRLVRELTEGRLFETEEAADRGPPGLR